MYTVLAVILVAAGVALLMVGRNFGALHRSKIPRHLQGSAGAKSLWLLIGGGVMILSGLLLFILRSIAAG